MTHLRRTATAVLATLVLLTGGVATATSASAIPPKCNGHDSRENQYVPGYVSGSYVTGTCYLVKTSGYNYANELLQESIRGCYGINLNPDGYFGAATKAAVVTVQRRHGLYVDGEYGPSTHNAMNFLGYSQGIPRPYCLRATHMA